LVSLALLKSVISYELDFLDDFDLPCTPCISGISENSDPKDFFKINSSRPPGILLLDALLAELLLTEYSVTLPLSLLERI
jgi:hypothetical protein